MTEKKIVEIRSKGESLFSLDSEKLLEEVKLMIFSISAICGAPLPKTGTFLEIITNQFFKFLTQFGYSELSIAEIELAFFINTQPKGFPKGIELDCIQFYGSTFNVDYAAKVLDNYMIIRNFVDRKFQNQIDGHNEFSKY